MVYLLTQVTSLSVQHCLILILVELYEQMKSLVESKFLDSNSVVSERSYSAELEAQAKIQESTAFKIKVALISVIGVQLVFYVVVLTMCLLAGNTFLKYIIEVQAILLL